MLRISNSKIELSKCGSSNDMSHFTPSHWTVMGSCWYHMSLEDYMAKKEFQEFNMSPDNFTKEQIQEMTDRVLKDPKPVDHIESLFNPALRYVYNMQQQIKKAGGQLTWQYDAVNRNMDGWVRQIVCLGSAHEKYHIELRRLSWFDVKIKIPVLEYICGKLNRLNRRTAIKEQKEWDLHLEELYKQKGA